MKYAALVYYQESIINAMTEQEWHDLNQECVAGVERLYGQGHYVAGQATTRGYCDLRARGKRC